VTGNSAPFLYADLLTITDWSLRNFNLRQSVHGILFG